MHAVNVRSLKKNPSAALRQAEQAPVLVLKGDEPNALLVHLNAAMLAADPNLKPALAAALFKDSVLSLGAAARISGLSIGEFLGHLSELGIDVVAPDETTDLDTPSLDQWLGS